MMIEAERVRVGDVISFEAPRVVTPNPAVLAAGAIALATWELSR